MSYIRNLSTKYPNEESLLLYFCSLNKKEFNLALQELKTEKNINRGYCYHMYLEHIEYIINKIIKFRKEC